MMRVSGLTSGVMKCIVLASGASYHLFAHHQKARPLYLVYLKAVSTSGGVFFLIICAYSCQYTTEQSAIHAPSRTCEVFALASHSSENVSVVL
jgi:hypothetical protein